MTVPVCFSFVKTCRWGHGSGAAGGQAGAQHGDGLTVCIQGTLVRINSGGSALNGSGSNADNAVDPQPAVPLEPLLADAGG